VKEQIGKKTYQTSDELKALGEKVFRENPEMVFAGEANIAYVLVYPSISKKVAGKCIRSSNELRLFSGKDYVIEMSGELWDLLPADVKELLMLHELMHVAVEVDGDGNEVYKMRDHDVQDFSAIIQKHGIAWLNTVKEKAMEIDDTLELHELKL